MPLVDYATLSPTGDPVRYDDALVIYPDPDVISTFGTIVTPKIHAMSADALEIASAGKVAVTLGDQHSLDLKLDASGGAVELVARGGKSLALESASEVLVSGASGVRLSGAGSNALAFEGSGVTISAGEQQTINLEVGGCNVASAYYDAVDRRAKLKIPSLTTDSGFDSDRLSNKLVHLGASPGVVIPDGAANDASGIRVSGAPAGMSDNRTHFDKSFLWRGAAADSMSGLGTLPGFSNESFWDLRGGAFRLTNVNQSSGDEISYVFRVNGNDELELVKRRLDSHTGAETFERVTRFGQKRTEVISKDLSSLTRGKFAFDAIDIPADLSAVQVDVRTFNAYNSYDAYFAVFPQVGTPVTTARLISLGDASAPGAFRATGLAPNANVSTRATFASLADGSAFQANRLYVVLGAIREAGAGGLASVRPVRKPFFMSGSSEQFFAQAVEQEAEEGRDRLSVTSPANLVLQLGTSEARAAILNTTQDVIDSYLADPAADPELHPAGKNALTLNAWIYMNYPEYLPFVNAATYGVYIPEPGYDGKDVQYFRHLDAVAKGGVFGYAIPAAHTAASRHAAGHDGALDGSGRVAGFVVIENGAARYIPEETPSAASGWTVAPGGDAARTVGGVQVDLPSNWQLIIDLVAANDVWTIPHDWDDNL